MKRINLKTITNALSKKEMMQFRGGWDPEITEEDGCITAEECGDGDGSGLPHFPCGYSTHFLDPFIYCAQSAADAASGAGPNGWWCCRCEAIRTLCGPW